VNRETVLLWHKKADNDLKAGSDELVTHEPATDTVCFHMQQCAEKYLKSFLVFHEVELPRTHNLAMVLQACIEIDPSFVTVRDAGVDELTDYAVTLRYPDFFYMPTVDECRSAQKLAVLVRDFVRSKVPGEA
jgi:HEPN domain-containing protein